jgi:NAD(P)H dehydrogenase (quinone)
VDLDIESREFDYSNVSTLAKSLIGIDHLLFISGSEIGQRKQQHQNVIDAAKESGVKWIVYTSLLHADTSSLSLAEEHLATEHALKESGIEYTILRNGWYTENYLGSIAGAIASGTLIGSAGKGKISSAARMDYAEAAAVVLSSQGHLGKVYELAGDSYYTLADLAAEVSLHVGKELVYNDLTEQQYANALKNIGLPDGLAEAVAGFDIGASKNDLFDDSKQLSALIGHPTTTLNELIKKSLS